MILVDIAGSGDPMPALERYVQELRHRAAGAGLRAGDARVLVLPLDAAALLARLSEIL